MLEKDTRWNGHHVRNPTTFIETLLTFACYSAGFSSNLLVRYSYYAEHIEHLADFFPHRNQRLDLLLPYLVWDDGIELQYATYHVRGSKRHTAHWCH